MESISPQTISTPVDVLVVGAGIAGLSARQILKKSHCSTLTIEKSRGCGGRMSSRRGLGFIADLGAQFTAASEPEWRAVILGQGDQASEVYLPSDASHPRYVHVDGMSAFARALMAERTDVWFNSKVASLLPIHLSDSGPGWRVNLESGGFAFGRSILITAPVPQSLQLLSQSHLTVAADALARASRLTYDPCVAASIELLEDLPSHVAPLWKDPSPLLAGVFHQARKRGSRSEAPTLVIHGSAKLSRELWDKEDAKILDALVIELQRVLQSIDCRATIKNATLHRWRYCQPMVIDPELFAQLELDGVASHHGPLLLAGDAFGRSSVEGAFVSGRAAGMWLSEHLRAQRVT